MYMISNPETKDGLVVLGVKRWLVEAGTRRSGKGDSESESMYV
jgi:hypothetical protein